MNFFQIRLPGESKVRKGCSEGSIRIVSTPKGEGLFYSEFEENPELIFIPADRTDFTESEMEQWMMENDRESKAKRPIPESTTDKIEHIRYIEQLQTIMEGWHREGIDHCKIIAARISKEKLTKSIAELYDELVKSYKGAAVFLFSDSEHGTWIGATPEILLAKREKELRTLSLAGTRLAGQGEQGWDAKNIEEQQIVTDFIANQLKREGKEPKLSDRYTLKAGPVEHIATDIHLESGTGNELGLIGKLAPTPALSGYPRHEAIEAIKKYESEGRECYGGVVGYIRPNGDFNAFANLRSGRIDSTENEIILYAGGGITLKSEPEKEWEETERKLRTLKDML